MTLELFIRYIHFISIITVAGSLVSEHMLLGKQVPRSVIKKLSVIDAIYGVSAILIVVTGLTMWFGVGKGADFYTKNPLMHIKFTLFVVLGVLSIWPSVFFLKNKKGDQSEMIDVPKKIFMFIRIEILLLFVIPYLAVLMAQGISF
jgi:putative membrane protein